jgi:hypothetical protein
VVRNFRSIEQVANAEPLRIVGEPVFVGPAKDAVGSLKLKRSSVARTSQRHHSTICDGHHTNRQEFGRHRHYNATSMNSSRCFLSLSHVDANAAFDWWFRSHGEGDMTAHWWCPSSFDRMDELSFKRVPEGWIFRAPNPWLFGPGRHYLVDQTQKSELSTHLRQMYRVLDRALMIIVAVFVAIMVPVAPLIDEHPIIILAGLLGGGAATAFVVAHLVVTHVCRVVQPLLAGLQPTTQRSTQGMLESQLAIHSRGRLAYYCLSSLVLFAALASLSSRISSGWNPFWLLGTILFGSGTVYWSLLLIAKIRSEESR